MEYYEDVVKKIQAEKAKNLNELKNDIIAKLDSNIVDKIHFLGDWYYIYSDSYTLGYDIDKKIYTINKFHSNQPMDVRFYNWNYDNDFKKIESNNKEEIINKFVKLVSKEYTVKDKK